MSHAMITPIGPVALANVRGSEKIPAPTIPPTTSKVSVGCASFTFLDSGELTNWFLQKPELMIKC